MSKSSAHWWTRTRRHSRLTAAAASALVIALVTVGILVWTSPSIPGTAASAIAQLRSSLAARHSDAETIRLKNQIAALEAKLTVTEAGAASNKEQLAAMTAKAMAATSKLSALEAQTTAAAAARASAAAAAAARGSLTPTRTTPKPTHTTPPPAPITAPTLAALTRPSSRYFGMYTEQAPFNWATYDATASAIGEQPNVVGYFGGWDQTFRADAVQRAWKRGTLPILTWESRPIKAGNDEVTAPDYQLSDILAGNYDSYLRSYAKAIVANGLPMGIRFDHEMNGVWYPWVEDDGHGNSINGNSAGQYVQVWKHVHDIFQAEGANKYVFWIWSPNIVNNLPSAHQSLDYLKSLYPGDAYVDWVGLSGYLRPAYKPDNDFSFRYTFQKSLDELRALTSKPIFLSEIGASETGGHKATWITSLFNGLADPANSDIIGFAWFNMAVTTYVEGQRTTNDWRIDSRSDTLASFVAGIHLAGNGFALKPTS
ncbi:glycoside hydrolase family 26 protein [Galbitalea soli]|uniref:GH26 domain-containing protein n=1 Tax=Galbitalea soli TaxID=1268042 RepID=A0A7C9PLV3_9MICO|nr:glycosyl hydrolase [Galbitalea soli]NEM90288.1 hypothetical protein [Galbitalea soli]NYJ30996.1 beta-mannanase [Galbitalea soli]